jgi:translation elongation factor EF-1beta
MPKQRGDIMRFVRSLLSVILAVAFLFAVFLLWRRYSKDKFAGEDKTIVQDGKVIATVPVDMGAESSSDGIGFTLKITEAQLAVLVEDALEKKIETENVGVLIGEGGSLAVSFSAKTQDLAGLLLANGKELPPYLRFGVSLLGETIKIDIAASVTVEGGNICVEPTAFGIMGLSVGVNVIPDVIIDELNSKLNSYVKDNIGNVTSIETKDKIMTVSGSLKSP